MNDEASERIWIDWSEREFHLKPLAGYVEYRRVDPPAAVNPLTEDRCMFCGGKTAHEPDCDHGRPTPAPSDERDKALVDGVLRAQCRHAALLDSEEFIINEANLRKALLDVLATVRAEEARENAESFCHWLLRAYEAGHRDTSYEEGETLDSVLSKINQVIGFAGYEPESSERAELLKKEFPWKR